MSPAWVAVSVQIISMVIGFAWLVLKMDRAMGIHSAVQALKESDVDTHLRKIDELLEKHERELGDTRTPMHYLRNHMMANDPAWQPYANRKNEEDILRRKSVD